MCEPTMIAATVAAVGTATSAYSQYQSGRYNAAVSRNNAALARNQAIQASERASLEKQRSSQRFAQVGGQARAGFAAGNVALGAGGTPETYASELQIMADQDRAIIDQNLFNEQTALNDRSAQLLQQAEFQDSAATGALIGGALSTGGTLLGGANQAGLFGKKPFKPFQHSGVPAPRRK